MVALSVPVAILGAGPAGLIAAEHLASTGHRVVVFDAMPSPLRKFLLAGRGGLNLTHSEPLAPFLARYSPGHALIAAAIEAYPPQALRDWAEGLGEPTFVGSSGRVFPKSFKATPLARAWLRRLTSLGVTFRFRHRWTGWADDGALTFTSPDGPITVTARATLLALGGASWPRLGSDGSWQSLLSGKGIALTPLQASNVGVSRRWSAEFITRNAGQPLKGCCFSIGGHQSRAEAVITTRGLEGGAIYALSAPLRAAFESGPALLHIDLKPGATMEALAARLAAQRKGETLANILRKAASLPPLALGLMREATGNALPRDATALARLIKAVPLSLDGQNPIDRAISTAGGIAMSEIGADFQLQRLPGIFVAGEMLDWDAPTGGYLLQASFATGLAAGHGIQNHLRRAAEV